MADHKAPDIHLLEIEAAAERAKLAATLDALTTAVEPTNVNVHVARIAQQSAGTIAKQTWSVAQKNPAAVALVGLGLGLLLTGIGSRKTDG